MRQTVYEALLETTCYEALVKSAEGWQSQFAIFTYPDLLDMTHALTERAGEKAEQHNTAQRLKGRGQGSAMPASEHHSQKSRILLLLWQANDPNPTPA